jgi:protein-disulfide isomerase
MFSGPWSVGNGNVLKANRACELALLPEAASMYQGESSSVYICQSLWAWSLFGCLLLVGIGRPVVVDAGSTSDIPIAEVNGLAITTQDLDDTLGVKLVQLEEQLFHLKRQELDALIGKHLLAQEAARRGTSVPALLDTEVTSKVPLVTEKEVEDFYQANRAQFSGNEAEIRKNLRASFQEQKLVAQRERFLESLRSRATIVDRLPPPPVVRVDVFGSGAAIRGAADASVTLVEFSDFHCPFCKRVQPTLAQLLKTYPEKVKLVYRDLPLDGLHPQARGAAEAARCAQDQGKFWEYHDALFEHSPKAGDDDLKRYAEQVGLDGGKFASCLFQSVHHEAVQRDINDATKLGITGTPAFFINGRFVNGAQPIEKFVQIIEEELANGQASAAVSIRKE